MGKSVRLTVEELTLTVSQAIFAYNNEQHQALGISPAAAWKWPIAMSGKGGLTKCAKWYGMDRGH
jgi:hypothetical protein